MVSFRFFFNEQYIGFCLNSYHVSLKSIRKNIEPPLFAETRSQKSVFLSLSQARFSRVFPPPLPHVVCHSRICTSWPRSFMPPSRGHRPTQNTYFLGVPPPFLRISKKKSGSTGSTNCYKTYANLKFTISKLRSETEYVNLKNTI